MAKEAKGGKAAKSEAKAAVAETFKYGVKDLADKLDIDPASVRIKLRNAGVKKAANGAYGWNTKEELSAVADQISAKKAPAKPKDDAKASTKKDTPAKGAKKAANDKGDKKAGKKAA